MLESLVAMKFRIASTTRTFPKKSESNVQAINKKHKYKTVVIVLSIFGYFSFIYLYINIGINKLYIILHNIYTWLYLLLIITF